jgi:hypothetical protein
MLCHVKEDPRFRSRFQDIAMGIIFGFENSGTQRLRVIDKTPSLLSKHSQIERVEISKPHTSLFFRIAKLPPCKPMHPVTILIITPPKF